MECIICKDTNSKILYDNTSCECKYKFHIDCWIRYTHSLSTIKCVLCRKNVTHSIPMPYILNISNSQLSEIQQTLEVINQNNNRINNGINNSLNNHNIKRILIMIICLSLFSIIILLLVLLL
jgi:hypothetical protein